MNSNRDVRANVTQLFPNEKSLTGDTSAPNVNALKSDQSIKSLQQKISDLEAFVRATCDWTWEADTSLRLTAISGDVVDLYGVSTKFFIGKTHIELAGDNSEPEDWERYFEAVNEGQLFRDIEYSLQLSDRKISVRVNGFPVRDSNGVLTGYQGTVIDISDIQKYRNAVDLASKRFVQAIDSFSGSFALFDENDRIVAFNDTYRKLHWFLGDELKPGLAFERCIRIQIEKGILKPEPGREEEWIRDRVERFHNPDGPFEVQKANNQWLRITEQRFPDGGCLKTMEDISEMKRVELELRSSNQRFRDFAEAAADWFFEFDPACRLVYLSKSFDTLTGQSAEDFLGKNHVESCGSLFPIQHQDDFFKAIEQRRDCRDLELRFEMPDGKHRYFSISGRPAYDDNNDYVGFRGIAKNTTETRELTDQLNRQASVDDLTGLPNRREFNRVLEQTYFDCNRNYSTAVLAFFDLDEFKIVNDAEGHVAGDRLLQEISEALSNSIDDNDVIARLGGDEFGLILKNCTVDTGIKRIERLLDTLRYYSFRIEERIYNVSASVGLVQLDQESPGIDELMRQIDIACYEAKEMGRNQIQTYKHSQQRPFDENGETINASDIEQALATDRFILFAQPIARASDQSITHHEILVRMLDEDGSLVMPFAFIMVAERYRLMTDIDRWVISNTCKMIQNLGDQGHRGMFTINLSGRTLTDKSLVGFIRYQLNRYGIDPSTICFEITETTLVSNFDQAAQLVEAIRNLGCRFALDDFGSGLSSFSYLKNFQVDYLKIDGSLVKDIESSESDRKMVTAIADMTKTMGMQSVAEFVETTAMAKILDEIGVDYLQGYGIGKPTPLKQIVDAIGQDTQYGLIQAQK